MHDRQLVFQRDVLHAQLLLQTHRCRGAALDRAVRGGDEAADAGNIADAANDPAAEDVVLAVVIVHAETGERGELEERTAAVEQKRHALARQQLAALGELLLL